MKYFHEVWERFKEYKTDFPHNRGIEQKYFRYTTINGDFMTNIIPKGTKFIENLAVSNCNHCQDYDRNTWSSSFKSKRIGELNVKVKIMEFNVLKVLEMQLMGKTNKWLETVLLRTERKLISLVKIIKTWDSFKPSGITLISLTGTPMARTLNIKFTCLKWFDKDQNFEQDVCAKSRFWYYLF